MAEQDLPRPGGLSEYDNPIGWAAQMYYEAGYHKAIADLQNDAPHRYLSWACWHADHDPQPELHGYCQTNAKRYDGTEKVAAECKFCPSKCVCGCHGGSDG
jgi:hypothetical protein